MHKVIITVAMVITQAAMAAPVKSAFIGDVEGMSKGAAEAFLLKNANAEMYECKLYRQEREGIKAKSKSVFTAKKPTEVSILEAKRAFADGKLAGECTQKVIDQDAKIKNF